MQFCVKHIRIVWVIAILLMAGGQAAHAYVDLTVAEDHAAERQQSPASGDDCPVGHCCGHCHVHTKLAVVDSVDALIPDTAARSFSSCDEVALDGPSRDIDYPPQLS